jgi:hypothetical protein
MFVALPAADGGSAFFVRIQRMRSLPFWPRYLRIFLLAMGWSSLLESFLAALIGLYAAWIIGSAGWSDVWMSVDTLLRQHLDFISWVKQIAQDVLPAGVVRWVFGLPALIYFPIRVILSCAIGYGALFVARRMAPSQAGHF